jgi:hypothetical protein
LGTDVKEGVDNTVDADVGLGISTTGVFVGAGFVHPTSNAAKRIASTKNNAVDRFVNILSSDSSVLK